MIQLLKAKYTWKPQGSGLKLEKGDQVQIQKGLVFQVLSVYKVDGRTAYWTDCLGVVYADELVQQ